MRRYDVAGGVIERFEVTEAPLRVAVTVTLCVMVVVAAATVNCADAAPAGMVTEDGTVNMPELAAIVTGTGEVEAPVKVIVQVPEFPDVSESGVQASV